MSQNGELLYQYAKKNYHLMFREAGGVMAHKFIVPGSVYSNVLWDWDSWLTNVALRQLADGDDIAEYEQGCILNYLDTVDELGRIPILIRPDSQLPFFGKAVSGNIHKPCLAQHAAFVIRENGGDAEWLRPHFAKLVRFADFYRHYCRHEETGLYFWLDDGAIGVDNDPCTFFRPDKSSGSIYLNCLMYKELEALCYIGGLLGEDMADYRAEHDHLREAVRTHCYDEKDGFYYSVDLNLRPVDPTARRHRGAPRNWPCLIQRIGEWSGFMAMWCGIATPEQAKRIVEENLLDDRSFWAAAGVRTLSKYEKMYQVVASGNPSCWLGPVWGISNYMVFRGLVNYGFDDVARELAEKTVNMFAADIAACGEMHEYYDPETAAPVINPGFQNWNLLAVNMQAWLDGKPHTVEF